MPISIQDQYIFKFSIGKKQDFITAEDLIRFEIIEEAGNVLPTFTLSFMTSELGILRLLNEGNDLEISFGVTNKMIDVKLSISKLRTQKEGDHKRNVSIQGVMAHLKFNNTPNLLVTSKKSGVEVILETAKKHFGKKIDTNITKSTDSQSWIQYNIPDKLFINEIWMHSWIPNSFIALGISMDGTFILKDVKKYIKDYQNKSKDSERYKYRFTGTATYKNDFTYIGDYIVDTEYGFINYWMGYKRDKLVYTFEDGLNDTISEEIKPIMALTNKLVRKTDVEKRFSNVGLINDNVHKDYWSAYLRNLSSLALFSSTKLEFSFENVLNDIKVLDLIMFQEPELDDVKSLSGEEISGLYLVSKVARTIEEGVLTTTILACREALNTPKGDLK